jgi:hypothetical protein
MFIIAGERQCIELEVVKYIKFIIFNYNCFDGVKIVVGSSPAPNLQVALARNPVPFDRSPKVFPWAIQTLEERLDQSEDIGV